MTVSLEKRRADLSSLCRVAACLINEHLVHANISETSITLSHPQSDSSIIVRCVDSGIENGAIYPSQLRGVVTSEGTPIKDGASLLSLYGSCAKQDVSLLCAQLENSTNNLEALYKKSRTPLGINSFPLDWEQMVVPRVDVTIVGDYDTWINQVIPKEVEIDREKHVVIPVHEEQLPWVTGEFKDIPVLPDSIAGRPQSSLRTLSFSLTSEICIKMPLSVKILGRVRNISPHEIMLGSRLEPVWRIVEDAATSMGGSLIIVREYAAAATQRDAVIVCAALIEHTDAIWGDMANKAVVLRDYCHHLFHAFLPSVMLHGVALQAHPQNILVRVDRVTRMVKGFVYRDLTSMAVHVPKFLESTSLDMDIGPSKSLEQVYENILRMVVHASTGSIIQAFGLGNEGWKIAREELEKMIPVDHKLARSIFFVKPTRPAQAYLTRNMAIEVRMTTKLNMLHHCQKTA